MVTNTELQELVRNIEAFVGIRDWYGTDPTFLDLFTQINGLRTEFEAFPTELNQYCVDAEDQLLEGLNFRKAAALQIDGLLKEDKNLHAEWYKKCQGTGKLHLGRGTILQNKPNCGGRQVEHCFHVFVQ
ncbi:hypothetical protein KY289_001299 [Solanum tuberosum]|nr:hypothetical protein KY289_001299 [Solanum tuberosum]